MIKIKILNNIYKQIKKYDEIIIARHIGPDPDAIAAQIALRDSIKLKFPNKQVYAVGLSVSKFKNYGSLDKIAGMEFNKPLLIALDVPNYHRLDGVDGIKFSRMIKIDHHPKEDIIGNPDWTEEEASSTCQMVAELILNTKLVLNKSIASNLYLGIVADSDRFLHKTTSVKTFEVTLNLLKESKIDFPLLYNELYERPINEIGFFAAITENIHITPNGLGYLQISEELLKEYNVDKAIASNIINNLNFIKELIVWIFITYDEKSNTYKGSIRSRGPVINELAGKYNGGGHKFASGVRINTEEDINSYIKDLDDICKEYKENN